MSVFTRKHTPEEYKLFVDDLITRSYAWQDQINPMAYDPTSDLESGYWLCKQCKKVTSLGTSALHEFGCVVRPFLIPDVPELIFVVGANATQVYAGFPQDRLDAIKKVGQLALQPIPEASSDDELPSLASAHSANKV